MLFLTTFCQENQTHASIKYDGIKKEWELTVKDVMGIDKKPLKIFGDSPDDLSNKFEIHLDYNDAYLKIRGEESYKFIGRRKGVIQGQTSIPGSIPGASVLDVDDGFDEAIEEKVASGNIKKIERKRE